MLISVAFDDLMHSRPMHPQCSTDFTVTHLMLMHFKQECEEQGFVKNESFVTVDCGRGISKFSICLVIGFPSLKFDHNIVMVLLYLYSPLIG